MRSRSVSYWKLASSWATSRVVNPCRSDVCIFAPHVRFKSNSTGQCGSSGQKGSGTAKVVAATGALRFRGPIGKAGAKSRHPEKDVLSRPSKDSWNVVGYSTAETFDLVSLENHLKSKGVYNVHRTHEELSLTCIVAKAKLFNTEDTDSPESEGVGDGGNDLEKPRREIFFFADGSVIFWSVPALEREMMLRLLRDPHIAVGPYDQDTVFEESELMTFKLDTSGEASRTHLDSKGTITLVMGSNSDKDPSSNHLERFAFSNAMAASVKLGALEASLDKIIDSIEFLSEDMKMGKPFATSRKEVLKKSGELFALRHVLNLSSDLLDTPDFYWDRENLESMYLSTCAHLAIGKRIRITNEKISHCVELLELVRNHLNDDHHTKLEWYIIILIMIEVCFEILHLFERFV